MQIINPQFQIPNSKCPSCGAQMMTGYRAGDELNNLVWACRACGATFVYDAEYQLRPYYLELYIPACPTCGGDMLAQGPERDPRAGIGDTWTCKACGEVINI